jgi:hypothetical protein
MLPSDIAYFGMPDEADTLSMGNEIAARWDGVVAAFCEEGSLAAQGDAAVWRGLGAIARLYDAATAGSNDPENAWWRFLEGKSIRRVRRRSDKRRPLFYGLIEHLSNEHASQDETRSKSVISRRAAVLQHWHDHERAKVPADHVSDWIAANGGVKAVAAIANPPKLPMTKADREAARTDREASVHQLLDLDPLSSMNWDVLPDNLRPFADGEYRLALIRVRETDLNAGAVDIIGMADDGSVSQRWLNRNAQGIINRLTTACRACGRDTWGKADLQLICGCNHKKMPPADGSTEPTAP